MVVVCFGCIFCVDQWWWVVFYVCSSMICVCSMVWMLCGCEGEVFVLWIWWWIVVVLMCVIV